MNVLYIGGTGNISASASRLAVERGFELHLLTRGRHGIDIPGAIPLTADIGDEDGVRRLLAGQHFDAVVQWVGRTPADMDRDIRLFRDLTRQYIFISSCGAYRKPLSHPVVTESSPQGGGKWAGKFACEERLREAFREENFPITVVRPSHTYATMLPVAVGDGSGYTVAQRMLEGKRIIVHGDGTSLWTVTHSDDFAKGLVGLLGNQQAIGHSFHITSDEILTWDQIYTELAHALGVEPDLVHVPSDFINTIAPDIGAGLLNDKAHSAIFDNTKIKRFVPGYQATIPFAQGIRKTLAWFDGDDARKRMHEAADRQMDDILEAFDRAYEAHAVVCG